MRVLVVAGARPNFMKIAPILRALRAARHESLLVHTGQHYDAKMSDAFFADLQIPEPDFHLGVGSGSHAQQTARVMEAFEPVLLQTRPDWLVVVGDVNSTLACALVASKLQEVTGVRIAHVEAGLRSGDWRMPEEVNRVLTDRLSDVLLTPSVEARANLQAEGIALDRVHFVGNVMIDTLFNQLPRARSRNLPRELGLADRQYLVGTLHRPSNVDDPANLAGIVEAVASLAEKLPVVLPLHPRTRKNIETFGLAEQLRQVRVVEPLGYTDMVSLVDGAAAIFTDSGGLQEETTALGVPCVTLREQTERPVTITEGTNQLTEWPLSRDGVLRSLNSALAARRYGAGERCPEGWDGRTAERIVQVLETYSGGLISHPASAGQPSL